MAHCLSSEVINSGALQSPQQIQNLSFLAIDIYAKLVFSILKVSADFLKYCPSASLALLPNIYLIFFCHALE